MDTEIDNIIEKLREISECNYYDSSIHPVIDDVIRRLTILDHWHGSSPISDEVIESNRHILEKKGVK